MEIFKGDDKTFKIIVQDSDDNTVDVSGAAVVFTVRKTLGADDAEIERKNSAAGGDASEIEMTDPSNGEFKIYLIPSNTEDLEADVYVYDIQITLGGKVYTILRDEFYLKEDVTK